MIGGCPGTQALPVVRGFGQSTLPPPRTFTISDVTVNSSGTALPYCIVKLFRTADDLEQYVCLSDTSGAYIFRVADSTTTWYAVGYLQGSPDVAGVTVNTLVGS